MNPKILLVVVAILEMAGIAAMPAHAGGVVIPIVPMPSISPGLSQDCVSKLDPKVTGAAANRAARACRRPTGPETATKPVARTAVSTTTP